MNRNTAQSHLPHKSQTLVLRRRIENHSSLPVTDPFTRIGPLAIFQGVFSQLMKPAVEFAHARALRHFLKEFLNVVIPSNQRIPNHRETRGQSDAGVPEYLERN